VKWDSVERYAAPMHLKNMDQDVSRRLTLQPRPSLCLIVIINALGLFLTTFATEATARASPQDKAVDAYVRGEISKSHITGLGLAVIRHGRIEKLSAYGFANVELSVPLKPTTRLQIASMTIEFTSVALMMLVEAGKVGLDDRIGAYLDNLPESWQGITIRRLLNHTTGLPDYVNKASESLADTPDEAIKLLRDRPMEFASGTEWSYNQTNYMLLQLLIEKLSGQSFEQFCEARMFAPLHLTSAVYGGTAVIPNRASLYTKVRIGSDPPEILDPMEDYIFRMQPMSYSGGGLNISVEDFARWLIALLDGRLISKASLDELWQPTTLTNGTKVDMYGLGWWLAPQSSHPAVGGNGGGRSSFFYYPKDDLAVIVLTNLIGSDAPTLVDGVAHYYFAGQDLNRGGK
jgi:CubicO group peptidase (beta-lactamase class C family)